MVMEMTHCEGKKGAWVTPVKKTGRESLLGEVFGKNERGSSMWETSTFG